MKRNFPILVIAIAAIVLPACQSKSKKEKNDLADIKKLVKENPGINAGAGTYSIEAPEGWTKLDTLVSGLKITTVMAPLDNEKDVFRENLNIITEDAKDYSVDDYAKANRKYMEEQLPEMKVIRSGETKIGDLPAQWVLYTFNYSGQPLKNTVYFIVKNNTGYVLTCSALHSDFDKFENGFKQCVSSFKIND